MQTKLINKKWCLLFIIFCVTLILTINWVCEKIQKQCAILQTVVLEHFFKISKNCQSLTFWSCNNTWFCCEQRKKIPKWYLFKWLGWQDLNLRMKESKSFALPLGYTPIKQLHKAIVVRLKRFELPTLALEGRCSIQLSYKRKVVF